jgi:hypothetical protein
MRLLLRLLFLTAVIVLAVVVAPRPPLDACEPSSVNSPWLKSGVSTEAGEAPAGQGATTENIGNIRREEQRRPAGCIAGRMQPDFHHGLLN